MSRVDELLGQAEQLDMDERLELAARLLHDFGEPDEGVEEAWAKETARRVEQLRRGEVSPVPWEEVRREALRALNARRS